MASAHCPGVINLSFGSVIADPQLHDAILQAVHNGCLVVAAGGNFGQEGSPAAYPASWPHVFTGRSNRRERRGDVVLEHLSRERHRRPGAST